jgi:uncharacterized membrane protein YgcG
VLSVVELLNLPPALAATVQYYGKDADVSVRCDTVGKQSYANFTIDGTKTNTRIAAVLGNAYFNDNIATPRVIAITRIPPTNTLDGDGYFYDGYAQKFSSALAAAGVTPNNATITLPDLSKFPSKALGYDVNCPLVKADGGDGSGGSGGVASGGGGSTSGGVASGGKGFTPEEIAIINANGGVFTDGGVYCPRVMACWRNFE